MNSHSLHRRPLTLASILLGIVAAALWAFFGIAGEMQEGEIQSFDESVLLALRNPADPSDPIGPGWVEVMMRDFTGLGGVGILTLVVCAAAGWLLLRGERRTAIFFAIVTVVGMSLSNVLKTLYDRPRPNLVPHGTLVSTASFPSGHSMMAAVVWLTLALTVMRSLDELRLKVFVLTTAISITLLVGASRVYLGVHWPSDVLAGWSLGAAWAVLSALAAAWLGRRGKIESAREDRG